MQFDVFIWVSFASIVEFVFYVSLMSGSMLDKQQMVGQSLNAECIYLFIYLQTQQINQMPFIMIGRTLD